jgi:hypothetical protein
MNHVSETEARFAHHELDDEQIAVLETLRTMFASNAVALAQAVPASRELSLALTHLEEAQMWVAKAISRVGLTPEARGHFASDGIPARVEPDKTRPNGLGSDPENLEVDPAEQKRIKNRLMKDED